MSGKEPSFFVAKKLRLYIFRNKHDKLMKILDATFDPCVGDELFLIEKICLCRCKILYLMCYVFVNKHYLLITIIIMISKYYCEWHIVY